MDTDVRKLPLGVVASIAPFNFPAYAFRIHSQRMVVKQLQHDSPLVNSYGRGYWEHPHSQAL